MKQENIPAESSTILDFYDVNLMFAYDKMLQEMVTEHDYQRVKYLNMSEYDNMGHMGQFTSLLHGTILDSFWKYGIYGIYG